MCSRHGETSRSIGFQQAYVLRVTLTTTVTGWNRTPSATLGSRQLQHSWLFLRPETFLEHSEPRDRTATTFAAFSKRLKRTRHTLQNLSITSLWHRKHRKNTRQRSTCTQQCGH